MEYFMECMDTEFNYNEAVAELEAIAAKVEDPNTGVGDMDKYIKRSEELIGRCRAYLRGVHEKLTKKEE